MELGPLLLTCAPLIAPDTAQALIAVESAGNPFAIGVVGGNLVRQPRTLPEAIATVRALEAGGWNYSVGLAQINKTHFASYGLNEHTAFDPCSNLRAMQSILGDCFARASMRADPQTALRQSFSCYYSGNFQTGFQHGYVTKIVAAWNGRAPRH